MKKEDFEELLQQTIATMEPYEYESLLQRMDQYRAIDYEEELSNIESRRKDLRDVLSNFIMKPDGAAILAPWLEEPSKGALTCSEWLRKARGHGFGERIDGSAAKSIFLRKIRPLVEERVIVKTLEGYVPALGITGLLRDLRDFHEMGSDEYMELYLHEIARHVSQLSGEDEKSLEDGLKKIVSQRGSEDTEE